MPFQVERSKAKESGELFLNFEIRGAPVENTNGGSTYPNTSPCLARQVRDAAVTTPSEQPLAVFSDLERAGCFAGSGLGGTRTLLDYFDSCYRWPTMQRCYASHARASLPGHSSGALPLSVRLRIWWYEPEFPASFTAALPTTAVPWADVVELHRVGGLACVRNIGSRRIRTAVRKLLAN